MTCLGVQVRAAADRTPEGEAAFDFIKREEPRPNAVAYADVIRFNAAIEPRLGRIYRLNFWAKTDRNADIVCAIAQPELQL